MNPKAHPVADGALQGLEPRGPSPPPSPRPRPSLVATFCLHHPRTARPGALHLLPGRSPIISTPTPCHRLHLGASGRFSNVAPVPSQASLPRARPPPSTKPASPRRDRNVGDQRMGRVPQRGPMRRGVRLRRGGVAAGKGPMTGGDAQPRPQMPRPPRPRPPPTPPTAAPPTSAPPTPPPGQSHPAGGSLGGLWERTGRRTDSHRAPFLTSCVTLGKCRSFSVLRLVSYETGVARVRTSESRSRRC